MKRLKQISLVLVFILLIGINTPTKVKAQQNIKLKINGKYVETEVAPIIENGRTLVPIRVVSEGLGYRVNWYSEDIPNIPEEKAKITIDTFDNDSYEPLITLFVDYAHAYVWGENEAVQLEVAPKLVNGRTLVPIRFIAEELNLKVDWDQENSTVIINEIQD